MRNRAAFVAIAAATVAAAIALAGCPTESSGNRNPKYAVTFNAYGGTPAPQPQYIAPGGSAVEPDTMTKTGFTSGGWYTEAALTTQWDFSVDTVSASIALHARWDTVAGYTYHTVSFQANGGTPAPLPQTELDGGSAAEPPSMTKPGSVFGGWHKDAALTDPWDFAADTVSADTTLYAKWNPAVATYYTLSAVLADGQSGRGSAAITAGSAAGNLHNASVTVTATANSGYRFDKWASDAEGTAQVSASNPYAFAITANTALYAVFAPALVEMVPVAGGTFTMGSPEDEGGRDSDETQHTVTVSGFYMGKYEVTQGQYRAVMGNNPSSSTVSDSLPVEMVTWYDAVEFCNKLSEMEGLEPAYTIADRTPASGYPITGATVTIDWSKNGYRLPTEAEWEYAARVGANWNTPYYVYAGSNAVDSVAWYWDNSSSGMREVGGKVANSLGIYDMSGNVLEWCWDWYGTYPGSGGTDPTGASSGSYRVLRGGGWSNTAARVRSAYRGGDSPSSRGGSLGFRLVRP